ncbi:hypothetical protein AH04_171 [Erwinia phage AH04]|uniref:Uncharacterized protein n=1 Tax=Erwinia phage AH04 TaxID=2869569 RepID=A0AAE7X0Y2_9CAUD|nr:hypothetical protein PQC02_gp143 [Erwinia phage AH04]QZA70646.1 hypothetical protein AH04_171 [Erwinia phage AH04]
MTVRQLEEMDFFDLKLLAEKKGIFYVRDGEVFIYHGNDKLKIDPNHPGVIDPFKLEENIGVESTSLKIGDQTAQKLDPTKDTKGNGYFWFWQHEEYFVLCFITETSKHHKGTVYMLRAGNATDSL